ncbi:unnamed protein product, partial [Polarella glacialis]
MGGLCPARLVGTGEQDVETPLGQSAGTGGVPADAVDFGQQSYKDRSKSGLSPLPTCIPSSSVDNLFNGSGAFEGPFNMRDARRAGFYTVDNPPEIGEQVVCFHRDHWLIRGVVEDLQEQVSNGQDGLAEGAEGARVTVVCE